MIIPIRVPHDAPLHTAGGTRTLTTEHPLYGTLCPACDNPLTSDTPHGATIALVYVGTDPASRKGTGFMTGSAVAVHAACAGLADPTPEAAQHG